MDIQYKVIQVDKTTKSIKPEYKYVPKTKKGKVLNWRHKVTAYNFVMTSLLFPSVPPEYNWSAGADNSVGDKGEMEDSEEGEIRDLISDSSTLQQPLSDVSRMKTVVEITTTLPFLYL